MLYLADKKAKLFKGDYKPVSLYLGDKKVTGYEYAEQTGEILSFERTYNDSAYIKMYGKTVETGEGEKSPDNPYELKSVGDDGGFDLVSSWRNLIPPFTNDYTVTLQGVTMSVLKGGQSVRVDGEFTGSSPGGRISLRSVAGRIKLEGGVTYTFSAYHVGGTYSGMSAYLNKVSDNTFIASTNFKGTGVQITPSEDTECYIGVVLSVGAKCEDAEFVFQIERGVSTSPYTPFRGMQTVHIPYTLRGQGDVRDTIEYIGGNRWRHIQRWGRKVFDGTEILNASTASSNEEYFGVYTLFENTALAPLIRRGYCSHGGVWTIGALGWASVGSGFIYNLNPYHFLRLPRTIANNVDEFRAFLIAEHAAGTPWTVEYELAEPIITYFAAPAPQTYYPYTQIYTTATVQPTLEAKIRVWEGNY